MTILVWAALPSDKVTPSHVVVPAHVHFRYTYTAGVYINNCMLKPQSYLLNVNSYFGLC